MKQFIEFPKMARLSRDIIITEKIDGTNASIDITSKWAEVDDEYGLSTLGDPTIIATNEQLVMRVGSRTKWITPKDDNYGFANWCVKNAEELFKLGEGTHFGEWWGSGIQRGYGLKEKRFSLFNTYRWSENRPSCCGIVPVMYTGPFNTEIVNLFLAQLRTNGSMAAPGFMKPEGIVVWHTAANIGFKKTIEKDELPKSLIKEESWKKDLQKDAAGL